MRLAKGHVGGTHRLVAPETTLARIEPLLGRFGITRTADVTGLDRIGIATYCVTRPKARTVQVSNGKGLRAIDAKVSGLMEAIELEHAENPVGAFRRGSIDDLAREDERFVHPARLPGLDPDVHLDQRLRLDWTLGEELLGRQRLWLPASAVYYATKQSHFAWTSNGLASGNHPTEATLHALYEVFERHAMSGLVAERRLRFDRAEVVDLTTIDDPQVGALIARVHDAGVTLVLLRPPGTGLPIHTFMAALCDPEAFGTARRFDAGYGAHLDPKVAVIRAITEAAQVRLTMFHGSREDIKTTTYEAATHARLHDFFVHLGSGAPARRFSTLASCATGDLDEDLQRVLDGARAAGFEAVYRAVLDPLVADQPIAVVKAIVPGALHEFPM